MFNLLQSMYRILMLIVLHTLLTCALNLNSMENFVNLARFLDFQRKSLAIVTLSTGLILTDPIQSQSIDLKPGSIVAKSRYLETKLSSQTTSSSSSSISLKEEKSSIQAKVPKMYEEINYEKSIAQRDITKAKRDSAVSQLKDKQSELNKLKQLMQLTENNIKKSEKLIQSSSSRSNKKDTILRNKALEDKNLNLKTLEKTKRDIINCEASIRRLRSELPTYDYRIREDNQFVAKKKEELNRKLGEIAKENKKAIENKAKLEKEAQLKKLKVAQETAQKDLETARRDTYSANVLKTKLEQEREVVKGQIKSLESIENKMKNRVSSLEAQLSQAKEELNNVHDKEVFNDTKLTSILASIDEATEDLKQKETNLKLSTNNFNAAVRALQKF